PVQDQGRDHLPIPGPAPSKSGHEASHGRTREHGIPLDRLVSGEAPVHRERRALIECGSTSSTTSPYFHGRSSTRHCSSCVRNSVIPTTSNGIRRSAPPVSTRRGHSYPLCRASTSATVQ